MSYELIRSEINLFAIFKNLEDLIALDETCHNVIGNKKVSIQFMVKNGPKAWIKFENDQCIVGQGRIKKPSIVLWFTSPAHLNRMIDGKANPIPLKGFAKLKFLKNEFVQITNQLAYFLKPELVNNPDDAYMEMNTRFTLTVAAFALPVLAKYEKRSILTASHIKDGKIQLSVLADGPSVYLCVENGKIKAEKGKVEKPDAIMMMKDSKTANALLNGKLNSFKAIASGEVIIKGQTPMLDSMSLILDKVNHYV